MVVAYFPQKSSIRHEEEFRSVPRATRSIETQAQKHVVSSQSVKSNAISVVLRAAEDALADAVLDVFYFQTHAKV